MFDWLRDRLKRRKLSKDRHLFKFFDGRQTRRVDPMRIRYELEMHPKFKWDMGYAVDEGDSETTETVIDAVCSVFRVQRWDGETETGMTGPELIALLYDYSIYVEELKKKHGLGSTSLPATELESSNSEVGQQETLNSYSV